MEKTKPGFFERANNWLKNSITIRLMTIGILILLLLIPVTMVQDLIREREYRQSRAISEVSSKWGNAQTISGLVLTVPYYSYTKVYDGNSEAYKLVESREYAHFLPDELIVNGEILPETRYRGIYKVIVYSCSLNLKGAFQKPDFEELKIKEEHILWEEAYVSLGMSDLRGIQQNVSVNWNGEAYQFDPGVESNDVIGNGISAKVPIQQLTQAGDRQYSFALDLQFNGSSSLNFIPIGKTTEVALHSNWSNPSFDGAFLPDERDINAEGFQANWEVLHLNRPYPQSFKGSAAGISQSAFGVNLIIPVDEYQKSMRSAKYAAMFIALTFLIFFFVQILSAVRIHPIQYIIVGLALCIFYILLIALSEHISFMYSYLIASTAIISMITLYAHSISKNIAITRVIGLILVILYTFIYSIIQMQDYALLMGGIGLFIVMAVVMYLSRKIDWYAVKSPK
ncbi:MAG: cell envelope integrity protein CreD [Bacteroidota bacterium]